MIATIRKRRDGTPTSGWAEDDILELLNKLARKKSALRELDRASRQPRKKREPLSFIPRVRHKTWVVDEQNRLTRNAQAIIRCSLIRQPGGKFLIRSAFREDD